ncbi:MAG: DUF4625 domain-containing protein [Tannerellaceae bacterium]|nr:DUF4625 domain-containing protein [Tannerellaceae bacterium]
MKFSTFLFVFTTLVLFTSCDKDDETNDTTPPAIKLISPAEGVVLQIGEKIYFETEFSDNTKLASYKVNIHSAAGHTHGDDEHEHGHGDDTESYEYNGSWNLPAEQTASVSHTEIVISDEATNGDYHFMVYCSDQFGNESYIVINVILSGREDRDHDHDDEGHDY